MMLETLGACLTILGAAGAGQCICRDKKEKVRQLFLLAETFSMVAGEIAYSRISLPEVLMEVGEKRKTAAGAASEKEQVTAKLGEALFAAGSRMCDGSGRDFSEVWQEAMGQFVQYTGLDPGERELLLSFPACVWYRDGSRQQAAVALFSEKLQEAAEAAAQKERENGRVTMAVSLACGTLAAILLKLASNQ